MKIHERYWSYSEQVALPEITKNCRFLWWTWTETYRFTKDKYNSKAALLEEVNKFIEENDIVDIISFKNTARMITILDYDYEYEERRGGIELVYKK